MDFVEGKPLLLAENLEDHKAIYRDVETAIKLLHEQNLVFGDLSIQNIMLKPSGGAMLIDFDWVGEHEVDGYPASWGTDTLRRILMDKEQDVSRLKELGRFLKPGNE